jgi:hypothetical protein
MAMQIRNTEAGGFAAFLSYGHISAPKGVNLAPPPPRCFIEVSSNGVVKLVDGGLSTARIICRGTEKEPWKQN